MEIKTRKEKAKEWQKNHPENFSRAKAKWLASMSKEQKDAYKAKNNEAGKLRRTRLSEEQSNAHKEKAKEWKKNHPENMRRIFQTYADKNPHKIKNRRLVRAYGITLAHYEKLLERQNGKCAVCGSTDPGTRRKNFCVDHCHILKSVRGLLCLSCNLGLGKFKDDPSLLLRAASYLTSP
jgi:hypothetical protein